MNASELQKLKVEELRTLLEEKGLPSSGKKPALVQRLVEAAKQTGTENLTPMPSQSSGAGEVPDRGVDVVLNGDTPVTPDATSAEPEPTTFEDGRNPLFELPMQLCRPSACHTYLEGVPETLAALAACKMPVVVVAGVGSQRIGKSTILNLLHSRRTSGFGLGHTLNAMTAGIWIWLRTHPKDPNIVVCLADTEGLDTPHIQQSYNWMLSSLTLLISGVFLYQSKSTIDSSATERLSTILAVAEQMLGQDDASVTTKPSFLWVLRDMQLQMKNDPKTEMMEKLETGHIRKMKKSFKDFDCFTLPRPVDKEEALQDVEKMEFTALKQNFQEEFFLLDRLVFGLASKAPTYGSSAVTGTILCELVTRYCEAIRERKGLLSSITELPSQAQLIAKMAGEKALRDGKAAYNKSMEALMLRLPIPLADLHEQHLLALASADKCIADAALGVEESDMADIYAQMRAYALDEQPELSFRADGEAFRSERLIKGRLLPVLAANERLATKDAAQKWEQSYAPVAAGVQASPCAYGSVQEFDDAVAAIKRRLMEGATSAGAGDVMARYLAAGGSRAPSQDRDTVMLKTVALQIKAVQEQQEENVRRLAAQQEAALEKEAAQRDSLLVQLRQEILEMVHKEKDARQSLQDMMVKEQMERTLGLADVKGLLQQEASQRAQAVMDVRAEVQAGDKSVAALELSTSKHLAAVRESISALDSKTLSADHEAETRDAKLQEQLVALSGRLGKAEEQQVGSVKALQQELQQVDSAISVKLKELDTRLSEEHHKLTKTFESKDAERSKQILSVSDTLSSQAAELDVRFSSMQQELSSLQFAHDDTEGRVAAATAAAVAATEAATAAKTEARALSETASAQAAQMLKIIEEQKQVEKKAVEMGKKASEAAEQAMSAKVDMEKAAAAAIASAHREMEHVWLGAATAAEKERAATGGVTPEFGEAERKGVGDRLKDFFKSLNV